MRGQVSFGRLRVSAPTPDNLDAETLANLGAQTLESPEGVAPAEIEAGWTAGDHVYDVRFEHEKNVFDDGAAAHFALRMDTNRVPAEIKRALKAQHETALASENPSGFLSRAQKRDVRDLIDHDVTRELASGRHRSSRMIPLLWDAERRTLLSAASGTRIIETLGELWRATFEGAVEPQSAGAIAYEHLSSKGLTRDLEDMRPSAFTPAPGGSGEANDRPEVGWASGSNQPHDFLGNELLIWLWRRVETVGSEMDIPLPDGASTTIGVAMDRSLEMECAWDVTGKQTLRSAPDGIAPIRLPEAADALATGKWPRKAGLIIAEGGQQWSLTLQADRWLVSACRLPAPDDEAEFESPREEAEWRIEHTRRIDALLLGLFHAFLDQRASSAWETERSEIRDWIASRRPVRRRRVDRADLAEQAEETPVVAIETNGSEAALAR